MNRKCLVLIFCTLFSFISYSQEGGFFFIKNFNRSNFDASLSNWDITTDKRGVVLAANYDGILTLNGFRWAFMPIEKNLPGLSVNSDSNNRIFIGTTDDFGFLRPNKAGRLYYVSLSKELPSDLKMGTFWRIITNSTGSYFYSPNLIVKWNLGKLIYWKTKAGQRFTSIFTVDDNCYFITQNSGVYKVSNDNNLVPIPNTSELALKGVSFMSKSPTGELIYGTYHNGFYVQKKDSLTPINSNFEKYAQKHRLFTFQSNPTESFHTWAIGTLTGGIITVNKELQVLSAINKTTGLSSDVIKKVHFDRYGNLWGAMNEGLSLIELSSPWKRLGDQNGFTPISNAIIKNGELLFIGTSEGLFIRSLNNLNKQLTITGKVWDINKTDSSIIIASQEGLFSLDGNELIEISDFSNVSKLSWRDSVLLVAHSRGISLLSHSEDNRWIVNNTVEISNPGYNSLLLDKNDLWISAKFNGIYRLKDPHEFIHDNDIVKYDTTSGLPDVNEIKIIKKDNQLLFTTSKGFYHFNEQTNRFEPDSSILKERININNIVEDKYGNYIISVIDENRKSHVEMLKKAGNEYVRDYIPFRRLPEMEITAIYPEDDYIWIAGGEGLFRFDRNIKKNYTIPFNTLVSQVGVRDSVIFYGNYYDPSDTTGVPPIILDQPEIFKPKLDFKDNSLTFNFSAAFYEAPERTLYSYYLENNEEGWSKWSTNTTKEYNNLSAGTYIFHVKSKNIYDTEGRVASYEFTILPPWYQTSWAYFLFGILGILFIWLIALLYTYRVRMQRRRLKLIIADRTYEVISQKKEIERQKDLLQLQFEKISKQKDSIEEKNSKLQNAQLETQNANKALHKLNLHLEKEVEKRTEKIKSTLHQLQLKNKELDTFIYRASHDLEGPISRISGLSALVKMAFPKDADRQYLDLIEVTAKNMKVLISKLTQVHNLHNAEVTNELIDINELLASVTQSLQHLENGSSVQYTFNIPEDTKIYGDTGLLTIILQNIIENALVFRKPRGIQQHITVSLTKTSDKAYITIHDVGTGIHPDHMGKLFDMFYRGTNESLGSGLGLYLAKMAIDRLEGQIEIKSQLHEYSEFTVILPQ